MSMAARHAKAATALVGLTLLLSACGGGDKPPEKARPVLVTRAGDGAPALVRLRRRNPRPRRKRPVVPRRRQSGAPRRRRRRAGQARRRCWRCWTRAICACRPRPRRRNWPRPKPSCVRARGDRARYAAARQAAAGQPVDARCPERRLQGRRRPGPRRRAPARCGPQPGRIFATARAARRRHRHAARPKPGRWSPPGQTVFTLAGDDGREVAIALPESHDPRLQRRPAGAGRIVECARPAPARHDPRNRPRRRCRRRAPTLRASPWRGEPSARSNWARARACTWQDNAPGRRRVPLSALQRGAEGAQRGVGGRSRHAPA